MATKLLLSIANLQLMVRGAAAAAPVPHMHMFKTLATMTY
jgi:hypothetical protein